ncbi:hypothetical protein Taro_004557 [Colocasia esculenta]|uniref:Calcineurin-like phosphoesterase domain-containing protein n=1 Tax=Colocasia esculenta TaxID=4460 RepID=A0A843TPV2_COLES|nr:hypothetical protein [Colocasia esculenta]
MGGVVRSLLQTATSVFLIFLCFVPAVTVLRGTVALSPAAPFFFPPALEFVHGRPRPPLSERSKHGTRFPCRPISHPRSSARTIRAPPMAAGLAAPHGGFSGWPSGGWCDVAHRAGAGRRRCAAWSRRGCVVARQQALPTSHLSHRHGRAGAARVFVLSDLHTDYEENMAWVRRMSSEEYKGDVLLVPGDVAETYKNFVTTMSMLRRRFRSVFFVPGNHDLWCRREGGIYLDSLGKLKALLDVCRDLGVETSPGIVDGLGIVPLYSWYHENFDKESDVIGFRIPSLDMVCKDFHACKWPQQLSSKDISLALYFDLMNEKNHDSIEEIKRQKCQIITFSHYVPRQELCPEKRMLFYPNLPKIIGSDLLEARLRSIHGIQGKASACHVFGHTHFCWDTVLDGIRYVQAPLSYPRERKRRMNGGEDWLPFCLYNRGLTDTLSPCWWSDYYRSNKREPDNTDLAPWVARFYKRVS